MDDSVLLPTVAILFALWLLVVVLEVCFKVWLRCRSEQG